MEITYRNYDVEKGGFVREMEIDLTVMPSGARYEDQYGQYLEIFHRIAEQLDCVKVIVVDPPASWWPLLRYLNCYIKGGVKYVFEHCTMVDTIMRAGFVMDRTSVEVLCGFRPECVDALWKIDMQWKVPEGRIMKLEPKKEFIVTTNGGFHRPEVLHYLNEVLPKYTPKKTKVVLVPCAADKPYPSLLHKEVLAMMPEDYYLAVVTGVLGIVPQDLWAEAPNYDSGIPNEWRVLREAEKYFVSNYHEHIVVYGDFNNLALARAFRHLEHLVDVMSRVTFVTPVKFYSDYLNLMDSKWLMKLKAVFEKEREKEIA